MLYLINFASLNRSYLKGLGYNNLKNDSRKKLIKNKPLNAMDVDAL